MKLTICDMCKKEIMPFDDADFSELIGFDMCSECSEEMPISISY